MKYSSFVSFFHYFRIFLYLPVLFPSMIIYAFLTPRSDLIKDLEQWKLLRYEDYSSRFLLLMALLIKYRDFRNLFYYRTRVCMKSRRTPTIKRVFLGITLFISQILLKRMNTLIIGGNIGGGLVLYHCYFGMICPDTMGENCKVWHGVTIGFKNDKAPLIGNNVSISTGAVISGDIRIGDNTKIGPNSLVIKDVDANCVVISDPSYVIKRNGKKVMEK